MGAVKKRMNTVIGIDIVDIIDVRNKINGSRLFLSKILSEQEIGQCSMESLAGKIAAKEAIMKTGFMKAGEWRNLIITTLDTGAPTVLDLNGVQIHSIKISIAHTQKTAVAVALYEKD